MSGQIDIEGGAVFGWPILELSRAKEDICVV